MAKRKKIGNKIIVSPGDYTIEELKAFAREGRLYIYEEVDDDTETKSSRGDSPQ